MSEVMLNAASQINELHALAQSHAEEAIDSACRAGELLLQVKAELAHGEFLTWLELNCSVSARQAQRYMRAAQGKPLPIRAIKCDTRVASWADDALQQLQADAPAGSWAHRVEELGLTRRRGAFLLANDGEVFVEPEDVDGHYFVVKLHHAGARIEHFGRPCTLAGVALALDLLGAQLGASGPIRRRPNESRFSDSWTRPAHAAHQVAIGMGLLA